MTHSASSVVYGRVRVLLLVLSHVRLPLACSLLPLSGSGSALLLFSLSSLSISIPRCALLCSCCFSVCGLASPPSPRPFLSLFPHTPLLPLGLLCCVCLVRAAAPGLLCLCVTQTVLCARCVWVPPVPPVHAGYTSCTCTPPVPRTRSSQVQGGIQYMLRRWRSRRAVLRLAAAPSACRLMSCLLLLGTVCVCVCWLLWMISSFCACCARRGFAACSPRARHGHGRTGTGTGTHGRRTARPGMSTKLKDSEGDEDDASTAGLPPSLRRRTCRHAPYPALHGDIV